MEADLKLLSTHSSLSDRRLFPEQNRPAAPMATVGPARGIAELLSPMARAAAERVQKRTARQANRRTHRYDLRFSDGAQVGETHVTIEDGARCRT